MTSANKQLFHLLSNVDITHEAHHNPVDHIYSPRRLVVPATFAVTWPDGTPCSLVENYLISRFRRGASVREDGGSLRATVAKLTHLIRYCWYIKRDFWELCDDEVYQLVVVLMGEMKPSAPFTRARDNNTVRAIVATAVEFLLWLQSDVLVNYRLIGLEPEYQVRLAERKVFDSRRNRHIVSLVYHRLPPRDTKEPKRPISREKRNQLWQGVSELATTEAFLPAWARKNSQGSMLSTYLKARRELLLELLEATGARPGELARLSVLANENCYKTQQLTLETLKRRRQIQRTIKLQPGVAMRLAVFIQKHRTTLLREMLSAGEPPVPMDRVFVGISGTPMSERSMTSEFSRISAAAGLSDYQSCMSMFRHRFITKQVALHLGIYLSDNNKTKEMMTDGDYRTILRKVATITGHGSEISLLHYLDMAWEELGTMNQIDTAISLDASIEGAMTQIISLIGNIAKADGKSVPHVLAAAKSVLENLQQEIRVSVSGRKKPH
jgi:site-specific recombinase XerD